MYDGKTLGNRFLKKIWVILEGMKEEEVILVDVEDNPIGTLPKMEAHENEKTLKPIL